MVPFLKNGLLPIDREYSDSEAEASGVPPEARPVISMRVTAEDAKMAPGNFVFCDLFRRVVPKTDMHRAERQLLRLALEGHTDKVLAEILEVSLSTIKKRWRVIHEVMHAQLPQVLPPESQLREGTRGTEERRHVLAYIREHLEELFPHLPVNA
jgi:DNA-binding CsgD family transcriptional regulator